MRIISGRIKGRRINTIDGLLTRPTLDRVREAIFGMLQFDLFGKTVLDLFAGSGCMSFEAVSRGAASAVMVDNNAECISIINENIRFLELDDCCSSINADCFAALSSFKNNGRKFDIVFLDPPYKAELMNKVIALIASGEERLISDNAIIVAEHAYDFTPEEPPFVEKRVFRKYGKAGVTVFRFNFNS